MRDQTAPQSPDSLAPDSPVQVGKVISLFQLTDSTFPTGRYVHSYGLEAFAQQCGAGLPTRASTLHDLLSDTIRFGVAPSDGVALVCSHRAVSRTPRPDFELIVRADSRLTAVKLAREARDASQRMGRALLREATTVFGAEATFGYTRLVEDGQSPGNHAVALGLLTASLHIPLMAALASELYAFSAAWVAAAIRLGMTDHHTAQALLHRVNPILAGTAVDVASRDVSDISSCTPLVDIMAMRHELAAVRLFAS